MSDADKPSESTKSPWGLLHIYGQDGWHDEAHLVGDQQALLALRDACNQALIHGFGHAAVSVADGETFALHIVKHPTERMAALELPYTRFEKNVHGRYPSSLVPDPGYEDEEILDDAEWFEAQRRLGYDYEQGVSNVSNTSYRCRKTNSNGTRCEDISRGPHVCAAPKALQEYLAARFPGSQDVPNENMDENENKK